MSSQIHPNIEKALTPPAFHNVSFKSEQNEEYDYEGSWIETFTQSSAEAYMTYSCAESVHAGENDTDALFVTQEIQQIDIAQLEMLLQTSKKPEMFLLDEPLYESILQKLDNAATMTKLFNKLAIKASATSELSIVSSTSKSKKKIKEAGGKKYASIPALFRQAISTFLVKDEKSLFLEANFTAKRKPKLSIGFSSPDRNKFGEKFDLKEDSLPNQILFDAIKAEKKRKSITRNKANKYLNGLKLPVDVETHRTVNLPIKGFSSAEIEVLMKRILTPKQRQKYTQDWINKLIG